jgi:tRNA modification GTPase
VRISGHKLGGFAEALTGEKLQPRHARLASFRDADGTSIDEGIALFYAAPHSYTGEDVVELQAHGGPVVLRLVLQRCLELGARVAEPGEFTRRAFLNGKLDLAQAEGVVDLIEATTTQAARSAVRSLRGEFSARIHMLVSSIISLRARVEATLDFPEEEGVDSLEHAVARDQLQGVRTALQSVLDAARRGSVLREGLHIALAGPPNVGKSSLLNRLAGEDVAIVTDIPGTTRDPVRQVIDIEGIPVHVIDTAGLRESADPVERIGVSRAWKAIDEADVVVLVVDASTEAKSTADVLAKLPRQLPRVRVMNKIDLLPRPPSMEDGVGETVVWLSAKTGEGLDLLRTALCTLAGWDGRSEGTFSARERHLAALRAADEHLSRAAACTTRSELLAEELRLAQQNLGAITGEFSADDLLGEIFSRFCIGK